MGLFIFGMIILVIGIAIGVFFFTNKKNVFAKDASGAKIKDESGRYVQVESRPLKKYGGLVIGLTVFLSLALTALSCVTSVSTGNTGVVTTFGRVENYTLESGFHVKAPWHTVTEMDNRIQKATVELNCFSSDIQEVSMKYTLNYQIDKTNAQEIYRVIGKDYYTSVIEPSMAEAVKVATAKYTAEQLVQTRSELAVSIETLLEENLSKYNIKVSSTAIEDMDFTDAFTNAVEAKQVAEQKKKQAEIEQAQELLKAQNDKEIATTKAEADAEVAKIQAEADKEVAQISADSAEYQGKKEAAIALQRLASINGWTVKEVDGVNKLFKADGTEVTSDELSVGAQNLIRYYYIMQWNGELPDTYVGTEDLAQMLATILGNGGTAGGDAEVNP